MATLQLLYVLVPAALLVLGLVFGTLDQQRHYRSLRAREARLLDVPAVTWKRIDDGRRVRNAGLAVGSVVVSVDYFRLALMALKRLIGGELGAHATILDRARREAILRMKESHPGADIFLNCRLTTSQISAGPNASVEVIAYGTAVTFEP